MPTITCPSCNGRFRSRKDLTGKQVRCPRCDASFVVDEDLDPLPMSSRSAAPVAHVAPPRSKSSSQAKSSKRSKGKKRPPAARGGGFPKPLLICLGIALAVGAGWYGLQAVNDGNLPNPAVPAITGGDGGGSGLASMLGMEDTPESLMDEFTDCGKELRALLAGVSDHATARQALEPLRGIKSELVDIRRRAILAPQVPKQELSSSLRKFFEDDELKTLHTERIAQDRRQQPLPDPDFEYELEQVDFMARSTKSTIRKLMELPPEPQNEFDEIQSQRMAILRQVSQRVMQVSSDNDVDAAAEYCRQQVAALQALADRLVATTGNAALDTHAKMTYREFDSLSLAEDQTNLLGAQGLAVEPIKRALHDVYIATYNIDNARPQRSVAANQASGVGQGAAGGRALSGRGRPEMGAGGRPVPKTGPAAADEVIILLDGDVFAEDSQDFQERVAIKRLQRDVILKVQHVIAENLGRPGSNSNVTGGTIMIRIPFEGDPQSLADKLSIGTIEAIDASARQIEVTVSTDLVDQVREELRARQ